MQIETSEQTIFNAVTYRVETPDGIMYVIIMESSEGKPIGMHISIGKAGAPLAAWATSLARMISLAFEMRISVNDIIHELSNMTSDRRRTDSLGIAVRSGPDGVCTALIKYRGDNYHKMMEANGHKQQRDEDDRPPWMAGRTAAP